ncbi:MAG: hypothetical protein ACXWWJ_09255, partial [Nitrospira sp.]
LHLTNPDPTCDLDYVALQGRPSRIGKALINSFGFGGKNVVLALSRVDVGVRAHGPLPSVEQLHFNHLAEVS